MLVENGFFAALKKTEKSFGKFAEFFFQVGIDSEPFRELLKLRNRFGGPPSNFSLSKWETLDELHEVTPTVKRMFAKNQKSAAFVRLESFECAAAKIKIRPNRQGANHNILARDGVETQ